MIDKQLLKREAAALGILLNEAQLEQFDTYTKLLLEKNAVMNLTAITDPDEIVIKHFVDSLTLLKYVSVKQEARIIDIGTGAGFPALPLLIARQDLHFTMVDSLAKRLGFVSEVLAGLGLSAQLVHARAEILAHDSEHREQYDLAVARAVAATNVLCEYCIPFIKQGGGFAVMKGSQLDVDNAANAFETLGAQVQQVFSFDLDTCGKRNIIYAKKISQTSLKYPRSSARISKKPL